MADQIKERPILFNGEMVRAILEGRKTQTRRVVKGQALDWLESAGFTPEYTSLPENGLCPYGQPGDRLWVRETWARGYVAQGCAEFFVYPVCDNRTDYSGPWKPSIHMPRAACRILLEVTGVRVERLQDISEADAEAEGVDFLRQMPDADETLSAKELYQCLWDSIHNSWAANPWVWVIEFTRIEA
jgi:hypothetical protein